MELISTEAYPSSWREVLEDEFKKPYFQTLTKFITKERFEGKVIYPSEDKIFEAFKKTPFDAVKVVILGQDPYHGEVDGSPQAHGLSFSVPAGIRPPPSLRNIFKELETDLTGTANHEPALRTSGDLTPWAHQGVLLLNACLTVRAGEAGSHQGEGWEHFTEAILKSLNERREGVAFVLWGRHAQAKASLIDESRHLILKSAHPSPLSAYNGFFGSRPFSQINAYLESQGKAPIAW